MVKLWRRVEQLPVHHATLIFWADPGIGKTSLAQQVQNRPVLHIDFDRGVGRSVNRCDAVIIPDNWAEVVEFVKSEDFRKEFKGGVVILDTVQTCLQDYIIPHIIKFNRSLEAPGGGLKIQGFGALKEQFTSFTRLLWANDCDLICIAHVKERKNNNESTTLVPEISGSSLSFLMQKADMMGYCFREKGKLMIDFNATEDHYGKNPINLPVQAVPHFTEPEFRNFTGELIQKVKQKLGELTEEGMAMVRAIEAARETMLTQETPEALTAAIPGILQGLDKLAVLSVTKELETRFTEFAKEAVIEKPEDVNAALAPFKAAEALDQDLFNKRWLIPAKKAIQETANKAGIIFSKEANEWVVKPAEGISTEVAKPGTTGITTAPGNPAATGVVVTTETTPTGAKIISAETTPAKPEEASSESVTFPPQTPSDLQTPASDSVQAGLFDTSTAPGNVPETGKSGRGKGATAHAPASSEA